MSESENIFLTERGLESILVQNGNGFPELRRIDLSTGRKRDLHDEHKAELVTPDATSGPAEWGRYHDAVREASRSFDHPQEGDIRHFLNARARNPENVDVPAFHEAVKRQRMSDLVDIIDHHMRRDGSLPRGARMVRTQAPRGYMRRALRQSSPEDLAHLHHRLVSVGHSKEKVSEYLSSRVQPDMWDQATAYEVNLSDGEFEGLIFDSDDFETPDWADPMQDIIEAIQNIKPEIHIHIEKGEIDGSSSS